MLSSVSGRGVFWFLLDGSRVISLGQAKSLFPNSTTNAKLDTHGIFHLLFLHDIRTGVTSVL